MRAAGLLLLPLTLFASGEATIADWPSHGGTYLAWRYSGLSQVNASNVSRLAPAWVFQTGDYANGLQATPIVVDGVLYLSTSSSWVFALNAATGRLLWEYRFPLGKALGYGKQNRGVAVGSGMVFLGTADNHVVGLDSATGRERWRVAVEDPRQCGCNITGAPLALKDMVVVGVTAGDSAHRGYLTAFDARTGRLRWRFHTIPGPGEKGHDTWPGDSWRFGGAATWMTGSFDPELNLLYWGVGNAAADVDGRRRRGDNLYTASVIALNPETGKLVWHYQEIPHDVWDYDSCYELILVDLPVAGRMRKLLVHATKAGYTWVLDRATGEFLKAWQYVKHATWVAGITETGKLAGRREPEPGKAVNVCPGAIGGKSWNQSAWSPRTGLLYVPVIESCNDILVREQEPVEGRVYIGGSWVMKPPPGGKIEGYLAAFDPLTGEKKWTMPATTWLLASILATAGDLLFTGDPEGDFFAVDARSGKRLWSFPTGAGHRGSAVTYSVGGRQFVATPTGWGSIVGRSHSAFFPQAPAPREGSALMVFALPEEK
ncbi:MAG: PQQ-dependent dehydrogenase, methanol/ethanol family [Acidimicrobiia bacterium]|nr:PQQ-dependent dehydrogenase, methanol/ethanol family [Acidimicrobiia bacterium]